MRSAGLTHWADILTVVLYFVCVFGVGCWSIWSRKRGNVANYFLAGRSMQWFAVGASIFGTNIGSEHFIGLAGAGAATGYVLVLFEWVPALLIQVLGWFFLPVFISAGVYTLPEYMQKRYGGKRIRTYLSCLMLIIHIISRLAVTVFSGALYIQLALNWNMYPSIVVLLIITGIFTILGGLTAVMYTDTAQAVIMVIGAFVVMGLSLDKVGGLSNLKNAYMDAVPSVRNENSTCGMPSEEAFHLLRDSSGDVFPWPSMILQTGVASMWYWCCDQIMVQRTLAAKNLSHAKGGTLLGGFLKILPMFIMIMPGMASRILFPDEVACVDPDACKEACDNPAGCSNIAYPKLVLEILPTGARGLLMAVMLSAIVTSLTSIFNSSSTVFTMDIWRRMRPKANQKELLIVGRGYIILLCVLTILWIPVVKASKGGQLFTYMVAIEGYIAASLPVLFMFSIFWKRTTEPAAFYALLVTHIFGIIRMVVDLIYPAPPCGEPETRPAFLYDLHYFYFSQLLMLFLSLALIVISLLTKGRSNEELEGVTYWTIIKDNADADGASDIKEDGLYLDADIEAEVPEAKAQTMGENDVDVEEESTRLSKPTDGTNTDVTTKATEKGYNSSSSRLRHYWFVLCGIPESQESIETKPEISIRHRLYFLKEKPVAKSVLNFLAILLLSAICFLIGFFH